MNAKPRRRSDRSELIEDLPLDGSLHHIRRVRSRWLGTPRDVLVYVPAGAGSDPLPVLYMHDGQNLFAPRTSFAGVHWRVGETIDELVAAGEIRPVIVVGISNTGDLRLDEYTPTRDRKHAAGGGASLYGRFLVDELMPRIAAEFRVDEDGAWTGIGGSSLGGLASLYIGLEWPDRFGRILAMSPSVWWDKRSILPRIRSLAGTTGATIWIDSGRSEEAGQIADLRRLHRALASRGWESGEDLTTTEAEGRHDEASWAERFPEALRFLYPPR